MHSKIMMLPLLLVVILLNGGCEACDCLYRIVNEQNDTYTNIRCAFEGNGTDVSDATFSRNGVEVSTDGSSEDPCLQETFVSYEPTRSVLSIRAVSQCDGYFSCGVGAELSQPTAMYSKPVEIGPGNGNLIIVTLEEGDNKTLPCYVSNSPIDTQTTTWYKDITPLEDHNTEESSYRIVNAKQGVHDGSYWCSVMSSELSLLLQPVDSQDDGKFKVTVKKTFVPATFNGSLTYDINEEGTAYFTTSAVYNEDYEVSYKWIINNTDPSNSEKLSLSGKLEQKIENFVNFGETMVEVIIWNTKYDNMDHTDSQIVTIRNNLPQPADCPPVPSPSVTDCTSQSRIVTSSSDDTPSPSNEGFVNKCDDCKKVGLVIGVAISSALVMVLIAAISVLLMRLYTQGRRPVSKPNSPDCGSGGAEMGSMTMKPEPEPEPEPEPIVGVLNMIAEFAKSKINEGVKMNTIILSCLRDLVESISSNDRIEVDQQLEDILERTHQILSSFKLKEKQPKVKTEEIIKTDVNGEKKSNTIKTDGDSTKGDIAMDGNVINRVQLDGDHQDKNIREKGVSESTLQTDLTRDEQELLISEILTKIKSKLRQNNVYS